MADYEQEMETLDGGSGAKESDTHSKSRIEADDGRAHKLRQQAAVLQETEAPDDDFRPGDTLVSRASPSQLITGERETEGARVHNVESSRIEPDDGRAHTARQTVRYTREPSRDSIRSIAYRYRQEQPVPPLPTIPSVSSDPEIVQQPAGAAALSGPIESTDHESETPRSSTAQIIATGKPHISLCQVR